MLTPDCNENYGLKLALCLSCRSEDKLEPRFNFEGHQLGVVSVDINLTGTRILLAHKTLVDFNSLLLVDLSGPGLLNFWYLSFKCINYDCNKMDFQSCALREKCKEPSVLNLWNPRCPALWFLWINKDSLVTKEQK